MNTYDLTQNRPTAPKLGPLVSSLKDQAPIERVVDRLGLVAKYGMVRTGSSIQGDCPTGHESSNHRCFSVDVEDNLFHCFHCGECGDIVSLVQLVRNSGFMDAVNWIVDTFAPDLKGDLEAIGEGETPEQKERYRRSILYRMVFEHGRQQLYEPIGKVVRDYLMNERHYDPARLRDTEFIFWDTQPNIHAHLLQVAPHLKEDIAALPLHGGFGDVFRLAIPFRDRHGVILGFLKRAHVKAGFDIDGKTGIRWDSTKGLSKPDLFGLNHIKNEQELIVVEGYPDATYLPALGLKNIVALGQAAFSDKYIEGLESKGIRRVILALDNDGGTGISNSEEVCRLMAGSDIQVFVLDPPLLAGHKDPDEYVAAEGLDAFRKLLEKAESAARWMTRRIISSNDISTDLGRAKAIEDVLEFADSLADPVQAEHALTILRDSIQITPEILDERFAHVKEKRAATQLGQGVENIAGQMSRLAREGKPVQAIEAILAESPRLLQEYRQSAGEKTVGLTEYLDLKKTRDAARTPGQRLGYALSQFPLIDEAMCGVQPSMVTLAADPNVGKTILMINLSIDLLKSNADVSLLFFSMDDSRDAIVGRMIAKLAGLPINDVQRKPQNDQEEKLVADAYSLLKDMAVNGRLDIQEMSESTKMGLITQTIRMHPNRSKLVCIIDGIYNVPIDGPSSSLREENIERANGLKNIVKLYQIPLLVTAELRKRTQEEVNRTTRSIHDIMETGKYGYNADVILLLTPHDPATYGSDPEPLVNLDFAKNKLSSFRETIRLRFSKAKATFTQAGAVNPFAFGPGGE